MNITAKSEKTGRTISAEIFLGNTFEEAVELFGKDTVFALFKAKAVIVYQDLLRRLLTAEKDGVQATDEEVLAKFAEFKLGVPAARGTGGVRKTAEQKLLEKIQSGTADRSALEKIMAEIEKQISKKQG